MQDHVFLIPEEFLIVSMLPNVCGLFLACLVIYHLV